MQPNRKPMMAGNWKMHKTAKEARAFLQDLRQPLLGLPGGELPDAVICPPFTALNTMADFLTENPMPLALGAQNMASHEEGAYTGETALKMLEEFNVRYVILGHSERREYYHETDEGVNAKTRLALAHGLTPIVCVGESLGQREGGVTDLWVRLQVEEALENISLADRNRVVIAYEPIWAIGTGKVCEPREANRVIGHIREVTRVPAIRVLYGGSMKPDNVAQLMAQPEIDGGLVGGASLKADSFLQLIQAAMPVKV